MRHFACFECNKLLAGQQYLMRDGRPYCCLCFDLHFADCCETCGQVIGLEEGRMTHNGHQWHARDACFSCKNCRKSLIGRHFLPKNSELFCCVDCLTEPARMPGSKVVSGSARKPSGDVEMAKVSMDYSLPEDCIGWESVSNRDDRSSVSTYSEMNFKWKNASLQDCQNLTETDSGLNLTFTTLVGHIPEQETNLGDDNKPSGFDMVKRFGNASQETISPYLQNKTSVGKGGQNDPRAMKDPPINSSPTICPTDYMINPERSSLSSPTTKSSVDFPRSPQVVNRTPHTWNDVKLGLSEESDVLYAMPFTVMSSVQAAGKLSPVNELYDAEPSGDDGSSLPGPFNRWDYSQTHRRNPESSIKPQGQLSKFCTYCSSYPCICHYKTSLPDLSYTSVICDRDWRQKPLRSSKSHTSKTPNLEVHKMEGRHRPSGYASDGALKRRRVKQHHQHEIPANPRSHRLPKLGTGHLTRSVHFPDELPSSKPLQHRPSLDATSSNYTRLSEQFSRLQLEWDACSSYSSSSGDSEFDYYLDRPSIPHSQQPVMPSPRRLKKRKNKQCIIS